MVRKRVQRTRRLQPFDELSSSAHDLDLRERDRFELGEILESARQAVLTDRQDRVLELWSRGLDRPRDRRDAWIAIGPRQRREI